MRDVVRGGSGGDVEALDISRAPSFKVLLFGRSTSVIQMVECSAGPAAVRPTTPQRSVT